MYVAKFLSQLMTILDERMNYTNSSIDVIHLLSYLSFTILLISLMPVANADTYASVQVIQ